LCRARQAKKDRRRRFGPSLKKPKMESWSKEGGQFGFTHGIMVDENWCGVAADCTAMFARLTAAASRTDQGDD